MNLCHLSDSGLIPGPNNIHIPLLIALVLEFPKQKPQVDQRRLDSPLRIS